MTTKYQLIVNADTAEEIANVAAVLSKAMGPQFGSPQAVSTTQVDNSASTAVITSHIAQVDEDDDQPHHVFAPALDPAQVFAPNVNAGATVPATPVLQPAATAGSTTGAAVELDPRGYPWDKRIHSANRTRMKENNHWKYARGVSQELKDQVEAELRAQGYGVAQTGIPLPTLGGPAVEQVPQLLQTPSAAVAPTAPQLPGVPPQAPAKLAGPNADSITERLTKGIQAQLVDANWVLQVLAYFGVKDLQDLANHPAKFVEINTYLDGLRATPGFETF